MDLVPHPPHLPPAVEHSTPWKQQAASCPWMLTLWVSLLPGEAPAMPSLPVELWAAEISGLSPIPHLHSWMQHH